MPRSWQTQTSPANRASPAHVIRPLTTNLPGDAPSLLDEVEQNIVICQWRSDQSFAEGEGLRLP